MWRALASLFITSFLHCHFAWSVRSIRFPWIETYNPRIESKSVSASLFISWRDIVHSQTRHENSRKKPIDHTRAISTRAGLFVILVHSIHFNHSIQTQCHYHRSWEFNNPLMIPAHIIMPVQRDLRTVLNLLDYTLARLLALNNPCQSLQSFRIPILSNPLHGFLHKGMLLIILHRKNSHPSIRSHSTFRSHLSPNTSSHSPQTLRTRLQWL